MDEQKTVELIRVFRLKTGEDVVAACVESSDDDTVVFIHPMLVDKMKISGVYSLYMTPWLPIDIIKHDMVIIHVNDILTIMNPTDEFVEKYDEAVSNLLSFSKQNLTEEEQYTDILENVEFSDVIH